jgi:hypothetical protein
MAFFILNGQPVVPSPLELTFPDGGESFDAADLRAFLGYGPGDENAWAMALFRTTMALSKAFGHPEADPWEYCLEEDRFTKGFIYCLIQNCRNGHPNVAKMQTYVSIGTWVAEQKHRQLPLEELVKGIEAFMGMPLANIQELMQPVEAKGSLR